MADTDKIIERLLANTAEIITPDEFKQRLHSGEKLSHYIGFEISGYVHIGQGLMSALVMKDLTDLGVKCTVWLADWHTWINDKLDGTKETAANIGTGYFAEAIRACFLAVGGDPAKLDIQLASSAYSQQSMQYWETVMNVLKHTSQSRLQRSISILGRQEGKDVDAAKLMYPAMQVADIFFLKVDIAHAGMDQRKAHVVMRDVADKIQPGKPKPIALHHPLIDSLKGSGEEHKMSKSDPESAIFVHDTPEEIARKIGKAFCPEKETKNNPVLNWAKHIIFWSADRRKDEPFRIARKEEHGGDVEFENYEELEAAFSFGDVHPMDLKAAVAQEVTALLAPVREHFARPNIAAHKEALDKVLQSR
ncbi:MAG: tyrosine--tRNA ligase [Candidatus Andersenbacteria bacterium]